MDKCEISDLRLWREANNWHLWSIDTNGKPVKLLLDGRPDLAGYTRRVSYFCDRCKQHWPRYEAAVHHTQVQPTAARKPPTRWRGRPGEN